MKRGANKVRYEIGDRVYANYYGSTYYAEVVDYSFPYYIIELSSGKQTSVYEDEIIEKV